MPHFHVLAVDHPGQPERRLAAREAHLAAAKVLKSQGKLIHAGAFVDEAGVMTGSVLLFAAETRAEVAAILQNDPYTVQNVWRDIEITEYKPAPIFSAG